MLASRIASFFRPLRGDACALMYHSIGDSDTPLTVTPASFESQMRWIRANLNPISAEQLRGYLAGGDVPPKSVLVTLDDGYKDNYTTAWPVLQRYDIPAVLFVATGFVDAKIPLYAEMLPALSWSEIRELHSSGMIEIGAHTRTHIRLSEVAAEVARRTIADSKADLEEALGVSVQSFCYPQGRFNPQVVEMVSEAGFRLAFGGVGHINRRTTSHCVPRVRVDRTTTLLDFTRAITRGL
jgi:peptidoglycan/xylan/chitin deacetylase (PgdA/CDA1 family)